MVWAAPRRRRIITLALLVGLVVIGAVLAGTRGPRPKAGASYTGTVVVEGPAGRLLARLPVAFAISSRGERVIGLSLPLGPPRACARSLPGGTSLGPVSAPVGAPSLVRLSTAILVRSGPEFRRVRIGTLELSATFHSFGRVSGALGARYSAPALRGCDARGGFSARATG